MQSYGSRSPKEHLQPAERRVYLPNDASPISDSDYFKMSSEFRIWLRDEKGKYFDELSGDKARSYFRKFVKAWNRGKLSNSLYAGIDPSTITATTQTAYKWSFAFKKSSADDEALRVIRKEVGAATYGREASSQVSSNPQGSGGRVQGPTLPSTSDLMLAREMASEGQREERIYKRKRENAEIKDRVEDMVGPREVGREGMLEKKRARRDADHAYRERGDDGFEADESTLLGGGDSFKDMIARRDAARKRYGQRSGKEDNTMAARERVNVFKEKEKATMDMFQQMAKQRFG